MELDKVISSRTCVRSFQETKKPNYRDIIKAIDSSLKSPLAGNLPSLKFILVSDKEKIQELAQAAQQDFISKAPYVVVICTDKKFLERYYLDRAERYARQQAGAAIENFLLKVTDMSLASCWIGAFSDETVKRILKIPDNIDVEALLPVGYNAESISKKTVPNNVNETLYFDKYKNKYMKKLKMPEIQG